MLKNHLKIAFRNLLKYKIYSFINIFSLSLGIASVLFLYIYIQQELSYDKHFEQGENIYRINTDIITPNNVNRTAGASYLLAPKLTKDYPEVKKVTRIYPNGKTSISYQKKEVLEVEQCLFVDSSFVDIFDLKFVAGSKKEIKKNPNGGIITKEVAQKIFGTVSNTVGKKLILEKIHNVEIVAVVEKLPNNTHFNFDILANLSVPKQFWFEPIRSTWQPALYTYVLLHKNTSSDNFEKKINKIQKKYIAYQNKNSEKKYVFHLQNLYDIHLKSDLNFEIEDNNKISYIYVLGSIGFFILLIASINYINLSTARASKRAKEVGVRKVVGAYRRQLIWQFLVESCLTVFIACLFSFIILELVLPFLNHIIDKELTIDYFNNLHLFLFLGILIILLTILSGVYPAYVLSNFEAISVLKKVFYRGKGSTKFRRYLVVFQFTISITFIITTLLIQKQWIYIQNKDLGFNHSQVLILDFFGNYDKWESFKETLERNLKILKISKASASPGLGTSYDKTFKIKKNDIFSEMKTKSMAVDIDFLDLIEVKILAGRSFENRQKDAFKSVIVNQTFIKELNLKNPIGKEIEYEYPVFDMNTGKSKNKIAKTKIVGVVKDFHLGNLRKKIVPLLIHMHPGEAWRVYLKVRPENMNQTLAFVKKTWEKFSPQDVFSSALLGDDYFKQYVKDQKRLQIFLTFTFLTILIACLGLLGLAIFVVEQKTKEIGIRKTLGASSKQIINRISRDFGILILIASLIALPIAYFITQNWLNEFEYKINLFTNWYLFIFAILFALLTALLTVFIQIIKISKVNPVKVLKEE